MSYWLGKHAVGESAHSVASKHQVAVSNEPEGATFGYLVECRCGWQARIPRFVVPEKVKEICAGTADNHFDRHLMESINRELIWENFSTTSDKELKKPLQSQEQQSVQQSVAQQGQQSGTSLAKQPAVPSLETKKVVASPSPQPTVPLVKPLVTAPVTPKPSTISQVSSSVPTATPSIPKPQGETK